MKSIIDFLLYLVFYIIFMIAVFIFATEAKAETYLNLNVSAYHFDRAAVKSYHMNEENYGAGLHYTSGDVGVMGGMYTNSILNPSWYVLATYTPLQVEGLKFGVIGGGVTGYKMATVIPAVGLFAKFDIGDYGINLIATPDVKKYAVYGFVGVQVSFKL